MTEQTNKVSWPGWSTNKLIGRGSFGAVYEIEREVFGDVEKAALKMISIPQNASDVEDMFGDGFTEEDITETFQSHLQSIVAEYSLMKKMNGCANIVNCDDVRYIQHEDGFGWDIYIKMELLTPLMKALPNDIPEEMAVKLAKDMCAALQICKKHGVIHRDIKPQNIFVSPYGDYKLGDFGIAKTVEKTMGGTKIGTYRYMAPEVYNNQPYNNTADIYSLGLVLYWMLNEKRMPFLPMPPAKVTAEMESETRLWRFQGKELPPPAHGSENLKRIILKACAFEPKDRYQDADTMLADLNNLSDGAVPVTPHVHSYSVTVAPPTCMEKGYTTYTCECGHSYQDDETPALGHSLGSWNVARQATEEEEGEECRTCSRCGHAETRSIPKLIKVPTPPEEPKKKKPIIPIVAGVAAVLAAVLLLPGLSGGKKPEETKPSMHDSTTAPKETVAKPSETVAKPEETTVPTEPLETLPVQLEWSDWAEELPEYVTKEDYEIREKTLYSSQHLETTTSTTSNSMDGWELYDTVSADGGYGPWSDWSGTAVEATSQRQVETQNRYRYRDKETTTNSASTLDGWEHYDTTYSWGEYGGWSEWTTEPISGSESVLVETKTQYSYRDIWITQEYSDWSGWSGWSDNRESTNDLKKEETRRVWGYYYYSCPKCGAHMHVYTQCYTWAGGCGEKNIRNWNEVWSTTSWDSAGLKDWYGTGRGYTYLNGELVFKWFDGNGDPKDQYRYATRSIVDVTNYGEWSDYSDTQYTSSSTCEVRTRTLYRYKTREQIPTYHFFRWGNWSSWAPENVSATDNRQVESTIFYRYCDKITQTTYCFRRWSNWSSYQDGVVTPSDTVRVATKTVYQYKSK